MVKHNLKKLFGIWATPCDTVMLERLDKVDLFLLRGAFKKVFTALQRSTTAPRSMLQEASPR
ncbi:MAG: hypothetical protein OXD01_08365 [Gammaproteobacteria bacterium]|nr:hypothetical protein [Gammaproteobacteria bacterium]